jgi:head-tail adaptor
MIFERKSPPLDYFVAEAAEWEEVCRAWCSLEPLRGRELFEAMQVQSQTTHKMCLTYTPETTRITTDCRAKLAKAIPVNEAEPEHIANYRIFEIDQIVNVKEQNRELELMVVEKT